MTSVGTHAPVASRASLERPPRVEVPREVPPRALRAATGCDETLPFAARTHIGTPPGRVQISAPRLHKTPASAGVLSFCRASEVPTAAFSGAGAGASALVLGCWMSPYRRSCVRAGVRPLSPAGGPPSVFRAVDGPICKAARRCGNTPGPAPKECFDALPSSSMPD